MKKLLVLVVMASLVLTLGGTALAAPPVYHASGGGTNDLGVVSNTISFTGLQTSVATPPFSPLTPENAKGEFQLVARLASGDITIHADVVYMAVNAAETDAWLGLKITQSTFAGIPVGSERVIRVQDNGEGNDAAADRISLLQAAPAWAALLMVPYPTQPWDNGNIQVK